jgi:hypothetical protein
MVDTVQSHGASLATTAEACRAVLFGAAVVAFKPVTLIVALAAAAPFFLAISAEFP